VEDYVGTGRPVGSGAVLEHSGLNVSSATIRNELALLEDLGLVLQLHTSGGRIPTTSGYRYYIGHLLPTPIMSDDDQVTIRHQFHQAHTELDEWLKLATAVLAHRAHNVALITSPRVAVWFKHVELVEAQAHTVLTIVVLADGTVRQELMAIDDAPSQSELRSYADILNRAWVGEIGLPEMQRRAQRLPAHLLPFADAVLRLVRRAEEGRLQVYHQGLGEMLSRPEFSPTAQPNLAVGERLRRVVDFLQQGLAMEDLLSMMAMESGVQVVIGGESPLQELEDYALVVGRYGGITDGTGVLGLLGPARMDYGGAISLVRYMTELMSDLVLGR
jgi:heat-inducible transcriptional repressor